MTLNLKDQFLSDLEKAPECWQTRGVFADWAEDNGLMDLAACLRWMVKNQKRPYKKNVWFNADTIANDLGDPMSDVPGAIYKLLSGAKEIANHKTYPTAKEAEENFQVAWLAAKEAGWCEEVK